MKDFTLSEVFLLSAIIDKMDLRIESEKLTKTIKADKLETANDAMAIGREIVLSVGIDIGVKFVSNLHKANKEVTQFIGSVTGKTEESVREMKLKELKQFFVDLSKTEGFSDFFEQAGESTE